MRGKALCWYAYEELPQDHPRLCGEKGAFPALSHRELGSPPPMRGKVQDEKVENQRKRITPAYAGKR